jgi:DNA-binding GntR family transcriptional regulator
VIVRAARYDRRMSVPADDPRTKASRIAEILRTEIEAGKPGPGGKLPSLRELADVFGAHPVTVTNGLRMLIDEGLIFSVPNRGYFVRDSSHDDGTANQQDDSDLRKQIKTLTSELQRLAARVAKLEERADQSGSA